MIGILDYGLGNIAALVHCYKVLGLSAVAVSSSDAVSKFSRLILPGVGSFDQAMKQLNDSGLRPGLDSFVLNPHNRLLGICVGMQMLATSSEEGELPGLNYIPGEVRALGSVTDESRFPLPHMGWNELDLVRSGEIGKVFDFERHRWFYFLHSFFYSPLDPSVINAVSDYGVKIPSVISKGNILGMQCHPEKSHSAGISFLKAFSVY